MVPKSSEAYGERTWSSYLRSSHRSVDLTDGSSLKSQLSIVSLLVVHKYKLEKLTAEAKLSRLQDKMSSR